MPKRIRSSVWAMIFVCILISTITSRLIWAGSTSLYETFDLTGDASPTQDVLELNKNEAYDIEPRDPNDDNTRALQYFWEEYFEKLVSWMKDTALTILDDHRADLLDRDNLVLIASWGFPNPETPLSGEFHLAFITDQDISAEPIQLRHKNVKYHYVVSAALPPQPISIQTFEILRVDLAIAFRYNDIIATFQDIVFSRQWYGNKDLQQAIHPSWYTQERDHLVLYLSDERGDGAGESLTPLVEVELPVPNRNESGGALGATKALLRAYSDELARYMESLRSARSFRDAVCDLNKIQQMFLEIKSDRQGRWAYLWGLEDGRSCHAVIPPPSRGGPYLP